MYSKHFPEYVSFCSRMYRILRQDVRSYSRFQMSISSEFFTKSAWVLKWNNIYNIISNTSSTHRLLKRLASSGILVCRYRRRYGQPFIFESNCFHLNMVVFICQVFFKEQNYLLFSYNLLLQKLLRISTLTGNSQKLRR